MALFESYERRIDKISSVLAKYGIGSVEECRDICKAAGFDPSIDLGAYAKGIYIVRLSDSNGRTVSRKIRL